MSRCDRQTRFDLPDDCRRILVVGSGGFGREVVEWASDAWPDHADRIAGFLSLEDQHDSVPYAGLGIITTPDDYRPAAGDRLLLAIGIPYVRRAVTESLKARGASFLTLVHPAAVVAGSAVLGEGTIACPYSIISARSTVGRFALLNYHSSIGHDGVAGDFSVLSPYAAIGGSARIEEDVFLGLHASVGPGRNVGAGSKVSANSCVLSSVAPASIVYGVPGRARPLVGT